MQYHKTLCTRVGSILMVMPSFVPDKWNCLQWSPVLTRLSVILMRVLFWHQFNRFLPLTFDFIFTARWLVLQCCRNVVHSAWSGRAGGWVIKIGVGVYINTLFNSDWNVHYYSTLSFCKSCQFKAIPISHERVVKPNLHSTSVFIIDSYLLALLLNLHLKSLTVRLIVCLTTCVSLNV